MWHPFRPSVARIRPSVARIRLSVACLRLSVACLSVAPPHRAPLSTALLSLPTVATWWVARCHRWDGTAAEHIPALLTPSHHASSYFTSQYRPTPLPLHPIQSRHATPLQVLRLFRALLEGGRIPVDTTPDAAASTATSVEAACAAAGEEGVGAARALLSEQTARLLCSRRRCGMYDTMQGFTCDWGLGLFVGAFELTGDHSSPGCFGHAGSQSSLGFCDPARSLAVAVCFNKRPGTRQNSEQMNRVMTALYEDLQLT